MLLLLFLSLFSTPDCRLLTADYLFSLSLGYLVLTARKQNREVLYEFLASDKASYAASRSAPRTRRTLIR